MSGTLFDTSGPGGLTHPAGSNRVPGSRTPSACANTYGPPERRSGSRQRLSEAAETPGRYGRFGGQYVPETLMPALEELQAALVEARADDGFASELAALNRDYGGRPTPLYMAERMSHEVGSPIWFKREDL